MLEVRADHHVRLSIRDDLANVAGPWFGVYPNTQFRVGLRVRPELGMAEVSSTPGGFVAFTPWLRGAADSVTHPGEIVVDALDDSPQAMELGVSVERVEGVASQLCLSLVSDAESGRR